MNRLSCSACTFGCKEQRLNNDLWVEHLLSDEHQLTNQSNQLWNWSNGMEKDERALVIPLYCEVNEVIEKCLPLLHLFMLWDSPSVEDFFIDRNFNVAVLLATNSERVENFWTLLEEKIPALENRCIPKSKYFLSNSKYLRLQRFYLGQEGTDENPEKFCYLGIEKSLHVLRNTPLNLHQQFCYLRECFTITLRDANLQRTVFEDMRTILQNAFPTSQITFIEGEGTHFGYKYRPIKLGMSFEGQELTNTNVLQLRQGVQFVLETPGLFVLVSWRSSQEATKESFIFRHKENKMLIHLNINLNDDNYHFGCMEMSFLLTFDKRAAPLASFLLLWNEHRRIKLPVPLIMNLLIVFLNEMNAIPRLCLLQDLVPLNRRKFYNGWDISICTNENLISQRFARLPDWVENYTVKGVLELAEKFFKFYTENKLDEVVVCLLAGRLFPRGSFLPNCEHELPDGLKRKYFYDSYGNLRNSKDVLNIKLPVVVQDPFVLSRNLASATWSRVRDFHKACERDRALVKDVLEIEDIRLFFAMAFEKRQEQSHKPKPVIQNQQSKLIKDNTKQPIMKADPCGSIRDSPPPESEDEEFPFKISIIPLEKICESPEDENNIEKRFWCSPDCVGCNEHIITLDSSEDESIVLNAPVFNNMHSGEILKPTAEQKHNQAKNKRKRKKPKEVLIDVDTPPASPLNEVIQICESSEEDEENKKLPFKRSKRSVKVPLPIPFQFVKDEVSVNSESAAAVAKVPCESGNVLKKSLEKTNNARRQLAEPTSIPSKVQVRRKQFPIPFQFVKEEIPEDSELAAQVVSMQVDVPGASKNILKKSLEKGNKASEEIAELSPSKGARKRFPIIIPFESLVVKEEIPVYSDSELAAEVSESENILKASTAGPSSSKSQVKTHLPVPTLIQFVKEEIPEDSELAGKCPCESGNILKKQLEKTNVARKDLAEPTQIPSKVRVRRKQFQMPIPFQFVKEEIPEDSELVEKVSKTQAKDPCESGNMLKEPFEKMSKAREEISVDFELSTEVSIVYENILKKSLDKGNEEIAGSSQSKVRVRRKQCPLPIPFQFIKEEIPLDMQKEKVFQKVESVGEVELKRENVWSLGKEFNWPEGEPLIVNEMEKQMRNFTQSLLNKVGCFLPVDKNKEEGILKAEGLWMSFVAEFLTSTSWLDCFGLIRESCDGALNGNSSTFMEALGKKVEPIPKIQASTSLNGENFKKTPSSRDTNGPNWLKKWKELPVEKEKFIRERFKMIAEDCFWWNRDEYVGLVEKGPGGEKQITFLCNKKMQLDLTREYVRSYSEISEDRVRAMVNAKRARFRLEFLFEINLGRGDPYFAFYPLKGDEVEMRKGLKCLTKILNSFLHGYAKSRLLKWLNSD